MPLIYERSQEQMNTEHTFEPQDQEERKKDDKERKQRSTIYIAVAGVIVVLVIVGGLLLLSSNDTSESKTYRIGLLTEGKEHDANIEGLKAGLAELGYVEGEDIIYVDRTALLNDADFRERHSDLDYDDLDYMEAFRRATYELMDEQVDLIVTGDLPTTRAAENASEDAGIPIIFTYGTGAAGWEFIESYTHPGGRVTGVTSGIDESTGKRMELLKRLSPDIQSVLWPYLPIVVTTSTIELQREAAATLGLELVEKSLDDPDLAQATLESVIRPGEVDALFVDITAAHLSQEALVALARRDGLPSMYPSRFPGALAVYARNGYQSGLQAARLVDKIMRGEDPGSLPVEFPKKFDLTIDLGVAEQIGLTVPDEMLRLADTVIPAGASD
jgi:putative ABC transport system substrate-binding protein